MQINIHDLLEVKDSNLSIGQLTLMLMMIILHSVLSDCIIVKINSYEYFTVVSDLPFLER